MMRPPPSSTLFPYTTLSRSGGGAGRRGWQVLLLPEAGAVGLDAGAELVELAQHEGVAAQQPGDEEGEDGHRHRQHRQDRKSTRLNSSHANISYAVFCLQKKK